MDVSPGPALERPGRETPDIGPDIQDHGRAVPVRNVVFPAQDLLDVAAHRCWTLDVHGAGAALLRQGFGGHPASRPTTEQILRSAQREAGWWAVTVSNCRPPGCKPDFSTKRGLTFPDARRCKKPWLALRSG